MNRRTNNQNKPSKSGRDRKAPPAQTWTLLGISAVLAGGLFVLAGNKNRDRNGETQTALTGFKGLELQETVDSLEVPGRTDAGTSARTETLTPVAEGVEPGASHASHHTHHASHAASTAVEAELERERLAERRRTTQEARDARREQRTKVKEFRDQLRPGADADTRLAAAREILGRETWEEGDELLLELSLTALADLEPASVSTELLSRLEACATNVALSQALARTIEGLGREEGAMDTADLTECYQDGPQAVQIAAAKTLASRGDETLATDFQDRQVLRLQDKSPEVRASAVSALGAIKSANLEEQVRPLLEDEEPAVRLASVNALCPTRDDAVIDMLRPLADDPDPKVKRVVTRALARHASMVALLQEK